MDLFDSGFSVYGGREPPDTMSLRYANTSLLELLGRPSLRFAEMSMQDTSKCACVIQEVFLNCSFSFSRSDEETLNNKHFSESEKSSTF